MAVETVDVEDVTEVTVDVAATSVVGNLTARTLPFVLPVTRFQEDKILVAGGVALPSILLAVAAMDVVVATVVAIFTVVAEVLFIDLPRLLKLLIILKNPL